LLSRLFPLPLSPKSQGKINLLVLSEKELNKKEAFFTCNFQFSHTFFVFVVFPLVGMASMKAKMSNVVFAGSVVFAAIRSEIYLNLAFDCPPSFFRHDYFCPRFYFSIFLLFPN
jgi:hypothetical protein